jgi:hypothetical protein
LLGVLVLGEALDAAGTLRVCKLVACVVEGLQVISAWLLQFTEQSKLAWLIEQLTFQPSPFSLFVE